MFTNTFHGKKGVEVVWRHDHAVHYFAKLRRFTDGTFTRASVEELLTIITVLQTCEYSGVNPLKFLLSGRSQLPWIKE